MEDSLTIKTQVVTFANQLAHYEVPAFRGAVLAALAHCGIEDALAHNHQGEKFRYSYPLIQYKRIDSKAAIVNLGDPNVDMAEFFSSEPRSLLIGDHHETMSITEVTTRTCTLGPCDTPKHYVMENWMPLNQKNLKAYNSASGLIERIGLLETILTGNILSMYKGLNVNIKNRVECHLTSMSEPSKTKYKGVTMLTLDVEFTCNMEIPQLAGLGNAVSVGYGVVREKKAKVKREKLFLLGGHDLEMQTIAEILEENNQRYIDRNLSWDKATLSAYQDVFADAKSYDIVAIELRQDTALPTGGIEIDHHNKRSEEKSSLEQVANLLKIKLSRRQKLIAANDSRYIDGMMAMGATEQEIAEIRKADRKAQGVTEDDERQAQADIENLRHQGLLDVVTTSIKRLSPIVDRLYPYKRILICAPEEMVYYGEHVTRLISNFNDEIANGLVYYGGQGVNKYFGIKSTDEDTKNRIIELMKQ